MQNHLLGGTFALLAAISWANAMILFKHGGARVPPMALNLFKNVVSLMFLVPTLWLLEGGLEAFEAYSVADVGILVLSGFLGITVADTLFFYSLNLVGVGIVSIVDCLYMPFMILFSWLLLAEQLTAVQYMGAGAILFAVYVTSQHEPPRDRTHAQLVLGIVLGVLDMALMTFGIVIAKPIIERTPLIGSTIIRVAAGALFLCVVFPALPRTGALRAAFRPSRAWWVTVPGSFLGAYLALVFWMGGFKNTYASVAGTLNQTASIFALILAALLLKEPLTRRKVVAVVLALAGMGLVMLPELMRELHL
jgi:drug/metabolite transporter (DMT)-like permease